MSDLGRRAPGPRQLLRRILDDAELVGAVRSLEPRALGRLVERVGLEDAGELVALVTTEQLKRVLDEDLWSAPAPGQEERFDPARFALWLEVMLEAGAERVAQRLTELPEELVSLAFDRMALVIDLDQLAVELSGSGEDHDPIEKALEALPSHEIDQYRLIARRHDGWDAFVTVVTELAQDHHEFLDRLLERACHAASALVEEHGGLYQVLTSEEMLESDAAAEREDRRAAEGYVPPADARAFLLRAERTPLDELRRGTTQDPITRAYFRAFARPQRPAAAPNVDRLAALLEPVRASSARPRRRLGSGAPGQEGLLTGALGALAERDAAAHERRIDELGYLANVLLAGATLDGGRFRPVEAAEAVLAVCELGLRELGDRAHAVDHLATTGGDHLFSLGWRLLHGDPARRTGLLARIAVGRPGRRS